MLSFALPMRGMPIEFSPLPASALARTDDSIIVVSLGIAECSCFGSNPLLASALLRHMSRKRLASMRLVRKHRPRSVFKGAEPLDSSGCLCRGVGRRRARHIRSAYHVQGE